MSWVHPFRDGNGRSVRLQTHCALFPVSAGLWSVSRGLARRRDEYYAHLDAADAPRAGDLDGRGNLSDRACERPALPDRNRSALVPCVRRRPSPAGRVPAHVRSRRAHGPKRVVPSDPQRTFHQCGPSRSRSSCISARLPAAALPRSVSRCGNETARSMTRTGVRGASRTTVRP